MKNKHLKLKNRLREYRKEKGLTQQELAEMVGSSRNTIVAIENRKFCPSAYLAICLCKVFGCRFEDLFYLNHEDNKADHKQEKKDEVCKGCRFYCRNKA